MKEMIFDSTFLFDNDKCCISITSHHRNMCVVSSSIDSEITVLRVDVGDVTAKTKLEVIDFEEPLNMPIDDGE